MKWLLMLLFLFLLLPFVLPIKYWDDQYRDSKLCRDNVKYDDDHRLDARFLLALASQRYSIEKLIEETGWQESWRFRVEITRRPDNSIEKKPEWSRRATIRIFLNEQEFSSLFGEHCEVYSNSPVVSHDYQKMGPYSYKPILVCNPGRPECPMSYYISRMLYSAVDATFNKTAMYLFTLYVDHIERERQNVLRILEETEGNRPPFIRIKASTKKGNAHKKKKEL